MEVVLGIAVLVGISLLWQFLERLWDEWSGAYGRWHRGEPLRASEYRMLRWSAELKRCEQRKVELRRQHNINPHLILDRDFRREFEDLGIGSDIYGEVIAASGNHCAACGQHFSKHQRKLLPQVDHIRPRMLYPHLLYVRSNLQVLCRSCNLHKSAYDGEDWREVVVTRRRAANKKKRRASAKKSLDNK